MEKDPDVAEGVNNTRFRMLDSRIGRWMSVDPAAAMYHSWSPYNLSMNNPIINMDPSGATVEYGNDEAENDVRSRTTEKIQLTQKMWDSAKKRQQKSWNKSGINVGDMVDNPEYNKSFANYIKALDESTDVFVITKVGADSKYAGYFAPTSEVGRFQINYGGSQSPWYGGNRFHQLFEEVYHAYSFTRGYFGVSTMNSDDKFAISNYDVYDELDAKIFSLEAGGFSSNYSTKSVQNGKELTLTIPTELSILADKESSLAYKALYLTDGFKVDIEGRDSDKNIFLLKGPIGGNYSSFFSGEKRTQRFNNAETARVSTSSLQAYPYQAIK